jgi:hypothetical protein
MAASAYQRQPIASLEALPHANPQQKWLFVGLDLAPNAALETGFCVIDPACTLLRMDKLYTNESILTLLEALGDWSHLVVAMDAPKNLAITGRFRQEELKYHANRLEPLGFEREAVDRHAQRLHWLYEALLQRGALPLLTLNAYTKVNLGLNTPFKNRSSQGCRALQQHIAQRLPLNNVPNTLAPTAVLDAMVSAYAAWVAVHGTLGQSHGLYADEQHHVWLEVLKLAKPSPSHVRPEWVPQ